MSVNAFDLILVASFQKDENDRMRCLQFNRRVHTQISD
jgi:hypothetical protein